jgi:hypothetical protein
MTEIIKETTITKSPVQSPITVVPANASDSSKPILTTQIKTGASQRETTEYLIYFFFGFLEVLLAIRLILKLSGASMASGFVQFVYGITSIFILPFDGIFRRAVAPGVQASSVLEPSSLIAIAVYMLLAWGIVKLLRISSGEKQET